MLCRSAQYEQRNAFMRSWAAQRQRRVLFLDFDALSLAPNAPPTTRDWDKHYMCGPDPDPGPKPEPEADHNPIILNHNPNRKQFALPAVSPSLVTVAAKYS